MTRKEEIEQEAKNYCKSDTYREFCIEKPAFIAGAQWADKTMIEKVYKWIETHIDEYIGGDYIMSFKSFIEDFKQTIEK